MSSARGMKMYKPAGPMEGTGVGGLAVGDGEDAAT
jgi:hypothetical protein